MGFGPAFKPGAGPRREIQTAAIAGRGRANEEYWRYREGRRRQTSSHAELVLPIVIQPYRKEHEPAVEEFNRRLQQSSADGDLVFSETAIPRWLPRTAYAPVSN